MNRQEAERVNIGDKLEVDGYTHSSFHFAKLVPVKAIVRDRRCQTWIMFTSHARRRLVQVNEPAGRDY